MVNKIVVKRSSVEVKQLQTDDKEITSVTDIADTLADIYSEISSIHPITAKHSSYIKPGAVLRWGRGGGTPSPPKKCWPPPILVPTAKIRILKI